MSVYYSDDLVTLHHGDALAVLRTLPDASVDCCVTSPPYLGLRSYLPDNHPDKTQEQGLEQSPAEYVAGMVAVFAEVRRVLADDGTLFLNLGDSYSTGKNLLGIPWRVAFALQDDGWILRNDIIWSKANAMPESIKDRLSTKHEHVFMFSKSRSYWFDLDPIREPHTSTPDREGKNALRGQKAMRPVGPNSGAYSKLGRNPGDVWSIATQPFTGAPRSVRPNPDPSASHFAVMPIELARRAVLAGCKPGGTVLDPFSGSGTTGLAAQRVGRKYVGIDLNADYLDLSLRTRLQQAALDLTEETA